MTPEQRAHYDNGIWMCAAHAPHIDKNWPRYSAEELVAMKRYAELKASKDLEDARAAADLRPQLEGVLEWRPPSPTETREGYADLHHVIFQLGGTRKHRARAVIEIRDSTGVVNSLDACIGEGNDRIQREYRDLRPGRPCRIPMFTVISKPSKFWLDKRFVPDHPFYRPEIVTPTMTPGIYVTDEAFINRVNRQALPTGTYDLRAVLTVGDTEYSERITAEWRQVIVSAATTGRTRG